MSSQHQKDTTTTNHGLSKKTKKDKQMNKCSKQQKNNQFEITDDKIKSSSSSTTVKSTANKSKSCKKSKDKSSKKDTIKHRKKRKQKSSKTKLNQQDQNPKTASTQLSDVINKSDIIYASSPQTTTSEGESKKQRTKHKRKKPEKDKKRQTSTASPNETKPELKNKIKNQSAEPKVKQQQDKEKSRESTRSTKGTTPATAASTPSTVTSSTTLKQGNKTKQRHTSHKRQGKNDSKRKEKQPNVQHEEGTSRHSRKPKLAKVKKEPRPSANVVIKTEPTQTSDPIIIEQRKPKHKSKRKTSEKSKPKKMSPTHTEHVVDKRKTEATKVVENKKDSTAQKLSKEPSNMKKTKETPKISHYEKNKIRKSIDQESIASDINPKIDKLKKEMFVVKSATDAAPKKRNGEATVIAASVRRSVPETSKTNITTKLKIPITPILPPVSESYETAGSLSNKSAISLLSLDASLAKIINEPPPTPPPKTLTSLAGKGELPKTTKGLENKTHNDKNNTFKPKKSEGTLALGETTQKSELSPPMKRSTKNRQQLDPKIHVYTAPMSAPAIVVIPPPPTRTNGIPKITDKATKEPQATKQPIKRKKSVTLKPNHESLLEKSASDTTLVSRPNNGDKTTRNCNQKKSRLETKTPTQTKPMPQHHAGILKHSSMIDQRHSDLNVTPTASTSTFVSGTGTETLTIASLGPNTDAASSMGTESSTTTAVTFKTSAGNGETQIKPGLLPKKSLGFDDINSEKDASSRSTPKPQPIGYEKIKTSTITKHHHKPSNTTKLYPEVYVKKKQKTTTKNRHSKRSLTKDPTSKSLDDPSRSEASMKISHNQRKRKSFRRDNDESYRILEKTVHEKPKQGKTECRKVQQPPISEDTEQYDRYASHGTSSSAADSGTKAHGSKPSHRQRRNRNRKQKRGGHGHGHRSDKAIARRESDRKASQAINTLFSAAAVGAVQSEKGLIRDAQRENKQKQRPSNQRYNHPPSDVTQFETAKKEQIKNKYLARTFQRKQRYNNSAYSAPELDGDDEIVLGRRKDRIILYAYITRELMNQEASMGLYRSSEWNETLDRLQTAISLQYSMTAAQETSFVRILFNDFELTTNDSITLLAKIQHLHLITAYEAESCYSKLWSIWAKEDVDRVTVHQFCEILKPHMRSGTAPFSFRTKTT